MAQVVVFGQQVPVVPVVDADLSQRLSTCAALDEALDVRVTG